MSNKSRNVVYPQTQIIPPHKEEQRQTVLPVLPQVVSRNWEKRIAFHSCGERLKAEQNLNF